MIPGRLSEVGAIGRVLLRRPETAFVSQAKVDAEWEPLGYTDRPDLGVAVRQYDALVGCFDSRGVDIDILPESEGLSIDSLYVRDAAVLVPRGVVLCRMGKPQRQGEPGEVERHLTDVVVGRIEPPGKLEGGDVVWLDDATVVVGEGYRTNAEGIRQLAALAGDDVRVITVQLPHHRGPADVFHLMSIISPIDHDLALVHSPLMPVPLREELIARGITLVEVAPEEIDTLGGNVLAMGPRDCLMVAGNPVTRSRLEQAGARITEIEASEISLKGCGGPTCLTRPLIRSYTSMT